MMIVQEQGEGAQAHWHVYRQIGEGPDREFCGRAYDGEEIEALLEQYGSGQAVTYEDAQGNETSPPDC